MDSPRRAAVVRHASPQHRHIPDFLRPNDEDRRIERSRYKLAGFVRRSRAEYEWIKAFDGLLLPGDEGYNHKTAPSLLLRMMRALPRERTGQERSRFARAMVPKMSKWELKGFIETIALECII